MSYTQCHMFCTFMYFHVYVPAAVAVKLLQSCLTLCNPIDGSPLSLGFFRQEVHVPRRNKNNFCGI